TRRLPYYTSVRAANINLLSKADLNDILSVNVETLGFAAMFRPASDRSLQIYLGRSIELTVHRRVLKLLRALEAQPVESVLDLHPAYAYVLVVFDPVRWDHAGLEKILRERLEQSGQMELPSPRRIEIPVCYGGEYGPDLDSVSRMHQTTAGEIMRLHSSAV